MKKMATLFLLVCTMTVFAFANSVKAHHDLSEVIYQNNLSAEQQLASSSHKSGDMIHDQNLDGAEDDECFCKERSKTTSFICGMVLAPASQYEQSVHQRNVKERFQFYQADRLKSYVSIQKRPPRTTL